MKFSFAEVTLFAAQAAAQGYATGKYVSGSGGGSMSGLSALPACGSACFKAAVAASGCQDIKCECTTGLRGIVTSVTACLAKSMACTADDLAKMMPAAAGICASAGVTNLDIGTSTSNGGAAPGYGYAPAGSVHSPSAVASSGSYVSGGAETPTVPTYTAHTSGNPVNPTYTAGGTGTPVSPTHAAGGTGTISSYYGAKGSKPASTGVTLSNSASGPANMWLGVTGVAALGIAVGILLGM